MLSVTFYLNLPFVYVLLTSLYKHVVKPEKKTFCEKGREGCRIQDPLVFCMYIVYSLHPFFTLGYDNSSYSCLFVFSSTYDH